MCSLLPQLPLIWQPVFDDDLIFTRQGGLFVILIVLGE